MSTLNFFKGECNTKGLKNIPDFDLLCPTSMMVCAVEPEMITAETKQLTAEHKIRK